MWSYLQNQYVSYCIVLNFIQYAICVSILIKTSKKKKLETNPDRSMKAEIQLSCFYSPLSCQMGKLVY